MAQASACGFVRGAKNLEPVSVGIPTAGMSRRREPKAHTSMQMAGNGRAKSTAAGATHPQATNADSSGCPINAAALESPAEAA